MNMMSAFDFQISGLSPTHFFQFFWEELVVGDGKWKAGISDSPTLSSIIATRAHAGKRSHGGWEKWKGPGKMGNGKRRNWAAVWSLLATHESWLRAFQASTVSI